MGNKRIIKQVNMALMTVFNWRYKCYSLRALTKQSHRFCSRCSVNKATAIRILHSSWNPHTPFSFIPKWVIYFLFSHCLSALCFSFITALVHKVVFRIKINLRWTLLLCLLQLFSSDNCFFSRLRSVYWDLAASRPNVDEFPSFLPLPLAELDGEERSLSFCVVCSKEIKAQ